LASGVTGPLAKMTTVSTSGNWGKKFHWPIAQLPVSALCVISLEVSATYRVVDHWLRVSFLLYCLMFHPGSVGEPAT